MDWSTEQIDEIWGKVSSPVFIFQKGDAARQIYANQRAAWIQKKYGSGQGDTGDGGEGAVCSFLELLRVDEVEEVRRGILEGSTAAAPLFCHLGREIYSAVLTDWEGYCVCMLQDVSRYYQDTQKALEDAQLANQAKTNFLSAISHDIRTPMNAIVGMTGIALMQKEMPIKIKDCLDKIQIASGHMMSLLNDVLDMSRIESGKMLLMKTDVDMADMLHKILIVVKPQAASKKLNFSVELGKMDEERLFVDDVRICQICDNLLSNAIKFTPEGGSVSLFFEVERNAGEKEGLQDQDLTLRIRVKDSGIGMAPDFLPRIFQPFERERSMTVSRIQGTGLGMAITQSLVRMMEGTISVESEVGRGSCFEIELPIRAAQKDLNTYHEVLRGKRILIFTDDRALGRTLSEMLENLGMKADWAMGAMEAVDAINRADFSDQEYFAFLTAAKVADVEMVEFLPQIRSRMGSGFPILMLSEEDWSETEYFLTKAGVDAFIPLPLFLSRLSAGLYAFTEECRRENRQKDTLSKYDFSACRILLVEDNELNREIAQEILGVTRASVETAENGEKAVEQFERSQLFYYDMILMDIQMPVMNGLDATRKIRSLDRPDASSVPIIAMTANAFLEDVHDSLEAGMNAHLSKPLDMEQVYDCLKQFLGRGDL